jgi:hypothetical protein
MIRKRIGNGYRSNSNNASWPLVYMTPPQGRCFRKVESPQIYPRPDQSTPTVKINTVKINTVKINTVKMNTVKITSAKISVPFPSCLGRVGHTNRHSFSLISRGYTALHEPLLWFEISSLSHADKQARSAVRCDSPTRQQ